MPPGFHHLRLCEVGLRGGGRSFYDEFANTVELMILILSTVMGAAFFGLGFYVIGVDNVLFKALFAFYCLMIPLRLLADVLNRVTATKELRMLGPINT